MYTTALTWPEGVSKTTISFCEPAGYAHRWQQRATDLDPDYLSRTNPSTGQPCKLRLSDEELEVAAFQFAKTQGAVRSPEYLGIGVTLSGTALPVPSTPATS